MDTTAQHTVPLTRIQKLIGRLMHQSKQTKANAYLSARADLTELTAIRRAYNRKSGVRVTTNDFFFYAIAGAIRQYPLMAATIDLECRFMTIAAEIGVGFAIAAPQGLVVPVIQDIGAKTLDQIAVESERLVVKARANKLMPDDFEGANIVLTSLGMYGIHSFYAIAPPSAAGILSIGIIEDTLVPVCQKPTVRKIMEVCLAFDHRVADEFYAAAFLRSVIDRIQQPQLPTE